MSAAGSVDHVLKGDGGMRASPAKGASPLRSGTSSRVCFSRVLSRQAGPAHADAGLGWSRSLSAERAQQLCRVCTAQWLKCMSVHRDDCEKQAGHLVVTHADPDLTPAVTQPRIHPLARCQCRLRRRTRRCWRRWRAATTRPPSCSFTSPSSTSRRAYVLLVKRYARTKGQQPKCGHIRNQDRWIAMPSFVRLYHLFRKVASGSCGHQSGRLTLMWRRLGGRDAAGRHRPVWLLSRCRTCRMIDADITAFTLKLSSS